MTDERLVHYKAALRAAREEFQAAKDELFELEIQVTNKNDDIAKLRRTITALAALCSESPFDNLGITEACMEVMSTEHTEVTTADVVNRLEGLGFEMASQKNAQASVHTVLNRLARKNHIARVDPDGPDGVTRWRGPRYDPNWTDDDDVPF